MNNIHGRCLACAGNVQVLFACSGGFVRVKYLQPDI